MMLQRAVKFYRLLKRSKEKRETAFFLVKNDIVLTRQSEIRKIAYMNGRCGQVLVIENRVYVL